MRIMSVKTALESIKPDERLIFDTEALLRSKSNKMKFTFNKQVVAACMPFILVVLFVSIYVYNLPVSYISFDVNPSLELGINRFDRVVDINYYNDDAEKLISKKDVYHRKPDKAIDAIMMALDKRGYLPISNATAIAIAANCEKLSDSDKLLAECTKNVINYSKPINVIQYTANSKLKEESDLLSISFGKLMLIKMIQQLDSAATVKEYKDESIESIMEYLTYMTSEKYTGADEKTKNSVKIYIDSIKTRSDTDIEPNIGMNFTKPDTEMEEAGENSANTDTGAASQKADIEMEKADETTVDTPATEIRAAAEAEKAAADTAAAKIRAAAEAEKAAADTAAAEARAAAEEEKARAEAQAAEGN